MIFNIQRFSTHDGTGIRTLIFYKGCPLHCLWCCNPESQSFNPDLLYSSKLCRSFGDCIHFSNAITISGTGIAINRMKLTRPEALRDICCTKALTVCGEEKTAAELLAEIEKDMPFYNGGGGVTLSGGEPLAQDETLIEFLQLLAAKKIDTAVETSLHVPWQLVQRCIRVVNTFLVDVKHTDQVKFHRFTGGDINLVYQNLVKIARQHPHVIARIPVIPGFNHTLAEMVRIIDFIHSLDTIREIHFLRYHSLGKQKYQMLGMKYLMGNDRQVSESELEEYIGYGRKKGFQVRVGG